MHQTNFKLPIGISDFKKLRQADYCFVDNSLFIKHILEESAEMASNCICVVKSYHFRQRAGD